MKKIFLLILAGLFVSSSGEPCEPLDDDNPEGYVTWLGQEVRSSGNTQPEEQALCDRYIKPAWYRVQSRAGTRMPEEYVPEYHCGTRSPIWLNDTHPEPEDGVQTKSACASHQGQCLTELDIRIKNCGEFVVYELLPTPGCPIAYCFGDQEKCDEGQTSPSGGYTPGCTDPIDSDLEGDPEIHAVSSDQENGQLSLECQVSYNYNPGQELAVEIEWLSEGVLLLSASLTQGEQSHVLQQAEWTSLVSLGQEIQCRARMVHNNGDISDWSEGQPLFLGIKIRTPEITVKEGEQDGTNLEIEQFLPFLCPDSTLDCILPVITHVPQAQDNVPPRCEKENYREIAQLAFEMGNGGQGGCGMNITSQSQVSLLQTGQPAVYSVKVKAVQDWKIDGDRTRKVEIRTSQDSPNPLWNNYFLGTVQVTVQDSEPKATNARCTFRNDPHIDTFDKSYYDTHINGEFVILHHRNIGFQLHAEFVGCAGNPAVSCLAGIYMLDGTCWSAIKRQGGAMVEESCGCGPNRRLFANGKFEWFISPDFLNIRVVINPSSTRLEGIDVYSGNMNPLGREAWGMCGDFDNNCKNDWRYPDTTVEDRTTDCRVQVRPDAFSNSWKIGSNANNLRSIKTNPWCLNNRLELPQLPKMQQPSFCTCDSNGHQQSCAESDIMPFSADMCIGQYEALDYEDRCCENLLSEFIDIEEPEIPELLDTMVVPLDWDGDDALEHCKQNILNSPAAKACENVTDVDFSIVVLDCATDLEATKNVYWIESAINSLQDMCLAEVSRNLNLWDSPQDGSIPKPPAEIVNVMCPFNCHGQGTCTNSVCTCNEGFAGADCSLNLEDPPEVFSLTNQGLCDHTSELCTKADALGSKFAPTDLLTCHVHLAKITESGLAVDTVEHTDKARYIHLGRVQCHLPEWQDFSSSVQDIIKAYEVSVSNNGKHPSQSFMFILHNPVCELCDTTTATCSIKEDSCRINATCFQEGAVHALDPCLACQSEQDATNWSEICTSSGDVWPYVLIGVGVACVIALVLVTVMFKIKKRKIIRVAPTQPTEYKLEKVEIK